MLRTSVPKPNSEAFEILFSIENGIRELIIDELSRVGGPQWHKQRLPEDVLKKFREAVAFERSVKWVLLTPHHPLYYVDFPDLRKVIRRSDNWRDSFRHIFKNESVIDGTLTEIELIRNKVAHNRKVSQEEVGILEAAHSKLATCIGESRFYSLAGRCTHLSSICDSVRILKKDLDDAYSACTRFEPPKPASQLSNLPTQWWFDEAYLGVPTQPVLDFLALVAKYESIPRARGEGYRIEKWLQQSGIHAQYRAANELLSRLACK